MVFGARGECAGRANQACVPVGFGIWQFLSESARIFESRFESVL
ncbi:hypothetical protein RBWH47_06018 [Rhodopirellula baltica WH47]|uniref:Uncharacterized protein n=1 Tax=Rhodopirellula baltica WH47 TaxID=991778 RepID=F2AWV4_RHOBT|nr:hypothetical protein RBWH47_06018 [Rhodopirellula baltica WH47]